VGYLGNCLCGGQALGCMHTRILKPVQRFSRLAPAPFTTHPHTSDDMQHVPGCGVCCRAVTSLRTTARVASPSTAAASRMRTSSCCTRGPGCCPWLMRVREEGGKGSGGGGGGGCLVLSMDNAGEGEGGAWRGEGERGTRGGGGCLVVAMAIAGGGGEDRSLPVEGDKDVGV
jgi:hypothetical protein